MQTPRENVLSVLSGKKPDRVPFIIWDNKIPSPDCDLPLAEARRAWPEKTILCNLPSALHHQGAAAVRGHARALLTEGVGDGRRFIVSVSEDLPNRGRDTVVALAEEVAAWKV